VTVISSTSRDIRGAPNSEEQVTALIRKRGAALKLHYPLAYSDDGTTADAWLKASGQAGWCTFVVDRAGRIAFMGSSMFLDMVLPKVLAGADPTTLGDEMAKVVTEYEAMFDTLTRDFRAGRDMKPGLAAVKSFEAKYPPLTNLLPVVQAKLSLLPKYGEPGDAKAYAEMMVADGIKREDFRLLGLASSILRNETANRDSLALAVKAAEACVRIHGGNDARSLLDLAVALLANGERAKAKEVARKAVEAAAGETPTIRQEIESEARRLMAEQ
jgi:hypothetical protein